MPQFVRGQKVIEGKTKSGYEVVDHPELLWMESKDDITAFNDPNFTQQMAGKAVFSTTTTCRVFELLEACGIPTIFVAQVSPTEFVVKKTDMICLEAIARRLAIGSYVKRLPWLEQKPPLRFHHLVTEFFLKTTKGGLVIDGETLVEGLTTELDDPLILVPQASTWQLFHPKLPRFQEGADLRISIDSTKVLKGKTVDEMDDLLRKVFLALEGLFQTFGYRLADIKIEFGITEDGTLVVSDVIDADSWRLLSWDWQSFSKQAFRDGESMSEIERKYGVIARISEFFRIPRQTLVVWKGSEKDSLEIPSGLPLEIFEIIRSGHKGTQAALMQLEEIQRDFPDGGVIIAFVGRSNGLGPTISAHTTWPVISCPADPKSDRDVWSSLNMPSEMAMTTCLYDKNAVLAALGILAQKNPALYMLRQYHIENLDPGY
jgi:phosphoribosylaminoimidazole carboxylase/phosphoribosylaminoimidazole-succinocarboxamide synthase